MAHMDQEENRMWLLRRYAIHDTHFLTLDERERRILISRAGYITNKPLSAKEVAQNEQISVSRVWQIETKAIEKLRPFQLKFV